MGVANWGCAVPYSLFIDVQPTALWNKVRELACAVVWVLTCGWGRVWVGTWKCEGSKRWVLMCKWDCEWTQFVQVQCVCSIVCVFCRLSVCEHALPCVLCTCRGQGHSFSHRQKKTSSAFFIYNGSNGNRAYNVLPPMCILKIPYQILHDWTEGFLACLKCHLFASAHKSICFFVLVKDYIGVFGITQLNVIVHFWSPIRC